MFINTIVDYEQAQDVVVDKLLKITNAQFNCLAANHRGTVSQIVELCLTKYEYNISWPTAQYIINGNGEPNQDNINHESDLKIANLCRELQMVFDCYNNLYKCNLPIYNKRIKTIRMRMEYVRRLYYKKYYSFCNLSDDELRQKIGKNNYKIQMIECISGRIDNLWFRLLPGDICNILLQYVLT
jgi:hypothetical protein